MYAWTPLRLSGRPPPRPASEEAQGKSLAALAVAALVFLREAEAAIAAEEDAAPLPLPRAAARVLAAFPVRRAILASTVAKRLGVDKSHVSRQVRLLLLMGLVAFADGPAGRGAPLRITARGRNLLRERKLRRVSALAGMLRKLDPRERVLLRAILERKR